MAVTKDQRVSEPCVSQSVKDQSRNKAWCCRCGEPVTYNPYAEAGTEWTHMTREQAAARLQAMRAFVVDLGQKLGAL